MKNLNSKKLLAKNSIINILGNLIPITLAIIVIPIIIHHLGKERFGILTILWAIIGYFNLIDFGVSRSLTKIISEKLAISDSKIIPIISNTAFLFVFCLSIVGTIILLLLSKWLVFIQFQISEQLREETLYSIYILAFSIPFTALTSSLKGILIAYQKFLFINIQQMLLSSIMFLSPLIIILFSKSLTPIILILFLTRIYVFFNYLNYTNKNLFSINRKAEIKPNLIKEILKFGGWLTVTNIIGPIMVYMDRVIMGIWIPVKFLIYYSSIHEVVIKILVLPGAIMNVIFPAFSYTYAKNPDESLILVQKSINYLFIIVFPILLFLISFTKELINLWLGEDFLINSRLIMQILLIGIFINSIGQVYFSFIQGIGKPKTTAIIHMVELPIYLFLLWYAVQEYGINGAAYIWTFRVIVDCFLLIIITSILFMHKAYILTKLNYLYLFSLITLIIPFFINGLRERMVYFIIVLILTMLIHWKIILSKIDRIDIFKLIYSIKRSIKNKPREI
ncbi:MAG: flippase [Calditrichaceae bacterium]|nr:flippase [Calditrichaceae bacterium]MBN2708049.1 flippase [Calditrichaceae bacterium]